MFQITHIQHQKLSKIFLNHNLKPSSEDFPAKLQLKTLISNSSADSSKGNQTKSFQPVIFRHQGSDLRINHQSPDKKKEICTNETYQPSNSYFLELDSTVEANGRIRMTSFITKNSPERSNATFASHHKRIKKNRPILCEE